MIYLKYVREYLALSRFKKKKKRWKLVLYSPQQHLTVICMMKIRQLRLKERRHSTYPSSAVLESSIPFSWGEITPYICIILKWNCSHPTDSAFLTTREVIDPRESTLPKLNYWLIDRFLKFGIFFFSFFWNKKHCSLS